MTWSDTHRPAAGYRPTAPGHPGGLCCGGAVATARVHFHTGRPHAHLLGYEEAWLDGIPADSLESFAGTGTPFSLGALQLGQLVVDVGCGAGPDSLIAVRMVGPHGRVTGVDVTLAMLERACRGASATGLTNVAFREGYAEALPVPDGGRMSSSPMACSA